MSITAIIQARVSSTRLPGKVLLQLEGKSVLEHVVNRIKACTSVSDIYVATSINADDDAIVKICKEMNINIYRGSLEDVLDRYYQAANLTQAKHIIRITADCPMIDPTIVEQVIKSHLDEKADYTSNIISETFPDGEDVEIFTVDTLVDAWENAKLTSEREHVTLYIRNHPEKFKLNSVSNNINLGKKRWTIDNPEDYEFLKVIFANLYHHNNCFGMTEILTFLKRNPDIESINAGVKRNEGLAKSLRQDKIID
jgi:spore coat polysaccharide biosynthesis protein SpsF